MLYWEQAKIGATVYLNKVIDCNCLKCEIDNNYELNYTVVTQIPLYCQGEVVNNDKEVCEVWFKNYIDKDSIEQEIEHEKIFYFYKNEESPSVFMTEDEYELWKKPQLILSGKYDINTIQFIMLKLGYLKDTLYNNENQNNYPFKI